MENLKAYVALLVLLAAAAAPTVTDGTVQYVLQLVIVLGGAFAVWAAPNKAAA